MASAQNRVDPTTFNAAIRFPYELRIEDFSLAMQDVYDFFSDVNGHLQFTEVYLGHVTTDDFRRNDRGELAPQLRSTDMELPGSARVEFT